MPTKTLLHRTNHTTATIRYTPNPTTNTYQTNTSHSSLDVSTPSSTRLYNATHPYDSDHEPLLQNTRSPPLLTTTTSNTSTHSHSHSHSHTSPLAPLGTLTHHSLLAPPLLPLQTLTLDSIIPAIITNVIPSPSLHAPPKPKPKHRQLLQKFKREDGGEKGGMSMTKVVFMPRSEYLKYFARGNGGEYVGTEPYRRWSEEELEREFGRYRPACLRKGGRRR